MKRIGLLVASVALLVSAASPAFAQSNEEKETFASLTTLAVRFVENRRTAVNMTGTSLSPRVTGKAEVAYKKNDARIKLKLDNLDSPQVFGPYYTTYVAWAVTPEGQTESLIELPSGANVDVDAQSAAQTFGLIITAEPHSAVKMPSQKVIAEVTLPKNVTHGVQTSQAAYRADKGAFYDVSDSEAGVLKADYTTPR